MPDVGDPRSFLVGAVAIFASYPASIWPQVIDPVHGLPNRTARPTLADITAACKDAYEPIARQITRETVRKLREGEAAREMEEREACSRRTDLRRAREKTELATECARLGVPLGRLGALPRSVGDHG
jgi:hypothetical protein